MAVGVATASSVALAAVARFSPSPSQHAVFHDRDRAGSNATDRQIDQLVYQLYGLTDDEIRIVEGSTGSPQGEATA